MANFNHVYFTYLLTYLLTAEQVREKAYTRLVFVICTSRRNRLPLPAMRLEARQMPLIVELPRPRLRRQRLASEPGKRAPFPPQQPRVEDALSVELRPFLEQWQRTFGRRTIMTMRKITKELGTGA